MSEEKMNICLCGCERPCKHNKNHWCEECKIEEKPNFWDDLEKIKSGEADEISHSISISGDVKTKMSKKEPKTNYTRELMKILEDGCLDIIRYQDGTPQAAIASSILNRTKKLREAMEAEYDLNE